MNITPFRRFLFAGFGLLASAGIASASDLGSDNASNYGGTWSNNSNFGTGFQAWSQTTSGQGADGFFIGDSTALNGGSGANINSSGVSFGLYANSNSNAAANANRNFNGALTAGQNFSFDLGVNYRNGGKGMDLKDASGNAIFTFDTTGDDYQVLKAATGTGSIGNTYDANTAFHLLFSQTTTSGGTWTITRSGGVSSTSSGTYTGDAAGFDLFISNTGNTAQDNLYANNFSIVVPEPSTWLAGFLVFAVAGWRLRRAWTAGWMVAA